MTLLEELQSRRLRLHRLDPPRPLRDARAAVAFIRERKIVLAAGRSSLPMLAEAIVGHEIRGSWMADPDVFRIHRLMRRINRSTDVVVGPLVEGKETIIDASLGPAVQRIAADRSRREAAVRRLPPLARSLLREVESSDEIRMDAWDAPQAAGRRARLLLIDQWLVDSRSWHTEGGYHTALVRPWHASEIATRFARSADRLDYDQACRLLWQAAVRSAVIAPEREAGRWFPFGETGLVELIAEGRIRRMTAARRTWFTSEKSVRRTAERSRTG